MSGLNRWVSDRLIDLVGAASSDMCDFVVAQARGCRDAASLLSVLKSVDVPLNDSSRRFAYQLLDKLQAGAGGAAAHPRTAHPEEGAWAAPLQRCTLR